ncbi:MAG: esterase [Chloroflexi bacterium]|nr:esterase [Chloroflexota bacterium]
MLGEGGRRGVRAFRGEIRIDTVIGSALRDNPHGDPVERPLVVCLPPGYETQPMRRYPVIYWLPGYTGTALSALNHDPWLPSVPEALQRAWDVDAPPAILVVVDGFTRFGGAQYLNSPANGNYEDYVVHDVVGHVDASYRTLAAPAHRGLAGKSSGGYGALVLAMRHPDVFGAVSAHSPDCYFELCYKPDFPKLLQAIARYGGVEAVLARFLELEKKPGDLMAAVSVAAMAMAYSPNPARPPYFFDLPFDPYTGELDATVWARWLAWDPVNLVAEHAAALRGLRLLHFECGTRDEYHLHYGARILARRLTAHQVPYLHEEFDDSHTRTAYRYPAAFARLAAALAPP